MGDVAFVAVTVAYFGLAVAYVRGCERIVGPDEVDDDEPAATGERVAR